MLIKQQKYWHNLGFNAIFVLSYMFATCSLFSQYSWILIIISDQSYTILLIIKKISIIIKICITSLNITTNINNKTRIPISLQHITQFLVDCQSEQQELAITNKIVVNNLFNNSGITICSIADIIKKQNIRKKLLYN